MAQSEGRDAAQVFGAGLAVITGAGAGIGAGLATKLASLGMTVVVADISADRAAATASSITEAGGKAHPIVADVADPDEMDRFAQTVQNRFGQVRILINNAGIETVGFTWEIPADRWDATLNINIHGVVHGCRAFLPGMIASGQECWVANLASVGGFGQMPIQTSYIMSKHAVQSFTECLALEINLIGAPVHVSSIIPGMVRTRIFDATAADQGPIAVAHRTIMRETMAAHGMDLDKACERIVDQLAAGAFWISTQPRMTQMFLDKRIAFLRDQQQPQISDELAPLFAELKADG
jgi:NAD(P)-dependent dehydrogenase (short-subunit alcohol dehydrogenase family)